MTLLIALLLLHHMELLDTNTLVLTILLWLGRGWYYLQD